MTQPETQYCPHLWLRLHPEHWGKLTYLPLADEVWEDYTRDHRMMEYGRIGTEIIDLFDDRFHSQYEDESQPGWGTGSILFPQVRTLAKWYFTRFFAAVALKLHEVVEDDGKTADLEGKHRWTKEIAVLCWGLATQEVIGNDPAMIERCTSQFTGESEGLSRWILHRQQWIRASLGNNLEVPSWVARADTPPYVDVCPCLLSQFALDGESDSSSCSGGEDDDDEYVENSEDNDTHSYHCDGNSADTRSYNGSDGTEVMDVDEVNELARLTTRLLYDPMSNPYDCLTRMGSMRLGP